RRLLVGVVAGDGGAVLVERPAGVTARLAGLPCCGSGVPFGPGPCGGLLACEVEDLGELGCGEPGVGGQRLAGCDDPCGRAGHDASRRATCWGARPSTSAWASRRGVRSNMAHQR